MPRNGPALAITEALDRGMLAALDAIVAAYRAPTMPDLPPLQGGVMGYLGYDVVREVEHLPNPAHDDRATLGEGWATVLSMLR